MPDQPRISVIIPHLNEGQVLARCLGALANQRTDGVPFEMIVVDNGSREPPRDVCDAVGGVRLEQELTPGPGPARNRGAAVAKASVLVFIDADCIALPGWLCAIERYLAANPDVSFVGGAIDIEPARDGALTDIEAYERIFSYRNQLYIEKYGFSATGNMAVRASAFQEIGPFGGISMMEDTDWGQRATRLHYKCAFVPEARVLTPSCKSFAELARRWDRHVSHEFADVTGHRLKLLLWQAKAVAIAASPILELLPVMRSDRLSGLSTRWRGWRCLMRTRLYRARLMTRLTFRDFRSDLVGTWNRQNS